MKLTISLLVVLAVAAVCGSVSAAVVTQSDTILQGWNLISMNGVPLNPDPVNVLPTGFPLSGNLYRFNAAGQSTEVYDEWAPQNFGNMLLGDGYWVYTEETLPYSYQALNDTDDMDVWISLPVAGDTFVGNPFSYDFPWENAKVTDGNETVSLEVAARDKNWIETVAWGFDAPSQSSVSIGLPDEWQPGGSTMLSKHSYIVQTYKDKLALILESQPH